MHGLHDSGPLLVPLIGHLRTTASKSHVPDLFIRLAWLTIARLTWSRRSTPDR